VNKHKKRKLQIAGLHLWAVKFEDLDQTWITTVSRSMDAAIEKATKFIVKRYPDDELQIKEVKYEGTLDA